MSKGAHHMAISLRFAEASPEMTALKAALAAKSYEVFLCDEAAGVDLMRTITSAFSHCQLVIVAATKTYGKQTTSGFSTYEEMNFFVTSKTPYFLIKMTTRRLFEKSVRAKMTSGPFASVSY